MGQSAVAQAGAMGEKTNVIMARTRQTVPLRRRLSRGVLSEGRGWLIASPSRYASTLALALLLATALRYGVGIYPNLNRMVDLAANWQAPVSPAWREDFWISSPLSAWTAGVLGLTEPRSFLLFHAALAILALLLPFALPAVRNNTRRAQLVFLVLAAGPIGAVLFSWLGSYDAVSVLAIVVATLSRSTVLRCLGWFILAFNHNALGMTALLLSLPIMVLSSRTSGPGPRIPAPLWLLGSVILGLTANTLLMDAWGAESSRLDFFYRVGFETYVHLALAAAPIIAFSSLGVGWLIIADSRVRSRSDGRLMLGTAVVATIVIPLVTLDQSRVLGLGLLAPVLLWATAAADHYQANTITGLWHTWRIPALVVPVVLVWYQGFVVPGWTWFLGVDPVVQVIQALPG